MSKRKPAPAAPTGSTKHRDVAEGRAPSLELASAVAIEAANRAAGFGPPPAALAVIEAADPAELAAARQLVAAAEATPVPAEQAPNDQAQGGDAGGQSSPQE